MAKKKPAPKEKPQVAAPVTLPPPPPATYTPPDLGPASEAARAEFIQRVQNERSKQVAKYGYAEDDLLTNDQLALAAACYASPQPLVVKSPAPPPPPGANFKVPEVSAWQWGRVQKWSDRKEALIKAATLLMAEYERLSRRG